MQNIDTYFRHYAAFCGQTLCILTNSSRLACARLPAPAPAHAQQRQRERHGTTASRHPARHALPSRAEERTRPVPRPSITPRGDSPPRRRQSAARLPRSASPSRYPQDIRGKRRAREEEREGKANSCARLPANFRPGHKASNPAPDTPDRSHAQQASKHQPATLAVSAILLLESLQNPGPVSPVSRRKNSTSPAQLPATSTGGAFTFSPSPALLTNCSVPTLYHVHTKSPFFTREQLRRFPDSKRNVFTLSRTLFLPYNPDFSRQLP